MTTDTRDSRGDTQKGTTHALVEVNFVVYWTHGGDFTVAAFYVFVSEPQ